MPREGWIERSPEECAVLAFRNARREPRFNVLLHVARCDGDDLDFSLMLRAMLWRWIPELKAIRPEAFRMWDERAENLIDAGGDLSADWYHPLEIV